jgi:hypothetical protein
MTKGNFNPLKATLSGSFHRDPEGLRREYRELTLAQCQVLSPRSLEFEDKSLLFVRHAVEKQDSVRTIELHHLQAIILSDFLWVHAPEGYIGTSGALEIGYALAHDIPIFSNQEPEDPMLKSFITKVPSVFAAIEQLSD